MPKNFSSLEIDSSITSSGLSFDFVKISLIRVGICLDLIERESLFISLSIFFRFNDNFPCWYDCSVISLCLGYSY